MQENKGRRNPFLLAPGLVLVLLVPFGILRFVPTENLGGGVALIVAAVSVLFAFGIAIALSFALRGAKKEALAARLSAVEPAEGNLLHFEKDADGDLMLAAVNLLLPKAEGIVAVFSGEDGAYRFCIGSRGADLSGCSHAILSAIGGKGGGNREMLRGSAAATRTEIEEFFSAFSAE